MVMTGKYVMPLTRPVRAVCADDGYRLTEAEAGRLVGFRRSYPWQGSRSSAFQ